MIARFSVDGTWCADRPRNGVIAVQCNPYSCLVLVCAQAHVRQSAKLGTRHLLALIRMRPPTP